MRGTISVDEDRCKGCELCITVCPKALIHQAGYFNHKGYRPAILLDPEATCTGCLLCSTICPEGGITVFREAPSRRPAQAATQATAPADAG